MISSHARPGNARPHKKEWYPMMGPVRYVLALFVLYCHLVYLCDYNLPTLRLSFYSVGGFFTLSGFLMYPNYIRHMDPKRYAGQRARRILPAYFFIVALCAFALCAASAFKPSEYFSDAGFYRYLLWNLCFLNWLEPSLPGVFDSSEYATSAVNASLWTMKVEWCLYLSLPIFIWFCRKCKIRITTACVCVIAISILYRIGASLLYDYTGNEIYNILSRQIFGMLAYFYFGIILYFVRKEIEKKPLLWALAGLCIIMPATLSTYVGHILYPAGISLLVIGLSLSGRNIGIKGERHNLSYEIYLFHFPIIQLLVPYIKSTSPVSALFIATAATVFLAIIYHLIIETKLRWSTAQR